ncbi:DUF2793 domain-containing protein [Bosea vestrisii]|uniref:DUF2793 domain-containing protein n=1 Tax=Bosea vestrisii TaxID=151416 RepID=UPI0024DF7EBD|nr:DUF2793 domain-containing protein [Bosea vestrisii]WID98771.1 DUF2793 domain-containing protein [Bosea vestrisii]
MSDTPRLGLPLLAAGQAQKHVTHNDALMRLDALVHLVVASRTQTVPPSAPEETSAYIVPADGTGVFAGHQDDLAIFEDGAWSFLPPRAGWQAWVSDEAEHHVWTGTQWRRSQPESSLGAALWGVNATADTTNRFAVAADASLFNHAGTDHRVKLNKANASRTASLLFQDGFSGRAEIGLTGDDQFRIKVSPDGTSWTEALVVDRTSGLVTLPASAWAREAPRPNLLINGDFQINQRAFAGGALAAGAYGHDRWKASGASSMTLAGDVLTLASGEITQLVERAFWGMASLASTTVTLSVEAPTQDLAVTVGSASGTITAGTGRRSVTLTTAAGDTGNIAVRLARSGAGSASFGRVKLELGTGATPWQPRPEESWLAARYCHVIRPGAAGVRLAAGQLIDTGELSVCIALPAALRTSSPSVTHSGLNRRVFSDGVVTGVASSAAHGTMLSLILTSAALAAGTSYPALLTTAGSGSYLAIDAEL